MALPFRNQIAPVEQRRVSTAFDAAEVGHNGRRGRLALRADYLDSARNVMSWDELARTYTWDIDI
jgi:hypothetical protein